MIKIYISILHFNTPKETNECLESLSKINSAGMDVKVVVIDNASREKYSLPKGTSSSVHLIRSEVNLGFAGGHNKGILYGLSKGAEFILILNNDTILEKDFLKELLSPMNSEKIGVTVPKIYFTKGHEFHKERYSNSETGKIFWYAGGIIDWQNVISSHRGVDEVDKGQYDKMEPTEFATGACLLIKREVLEKTKGFDERYFLYYEDGDLNMKVKRLGYKILYVPKSIVWHNNAGSSGSGSTLQDYYISRNRLLFGMSYAPPRARVALFRESLKILVSGRKWQKIGVRDYYLKRFGRGTFVPGSS